MPHESRRRVRRIVGVGAAAAAAVAMTTVGAPAIAAPQAAPAANDTKGSAFAGDKVDQLPDLDSRSGTAAPTAAQRSAASRAENARGAAAADVTWNRLGSVKTMAPDGKGALATGLGANPEKAARAFLTQQAATFGLTAADVQAMDHLATNKVGKADVVMLRQTVGGIPAGIDGIAVVAVENGTARYVSSTLAPLAGKSSSRAAAPKLSAEQALEAAAKNIGTKATKVKSKGTQRSSSATWTTMTASGLLGDQFAQQVAVPVPGKGARTAYQVVTRDAQDSGYTVYVDATTGEVIARESLVDFDSDNPRWKVFTSNPVAGSSSDTRVEWCWTTAAGCSETMQSPASPKAWDVDPTLNLPTYTTSGNNAFSGARWVSGGPVTPATPKTDRNYVYPWTNQWFEQKCNPSVYSSPERNDIDAATTNLFAMHNRVHDWSYRLGFTETAWNFQRDNYGKGGLGNDPVLGYSQSGAQSGSRNNANFGTPPDGVSGYSNMYLWQPLAGGFYAPCVDGDYDMSVIGHEYGHGISNRMAGGPNNGLSGLQAGAMGESWSDLMATEYLQEWGYVPVSSTATPMGAYVTGNPERGIRNYNFSKSPLNYSNVGYDLTGPQVHADGEIWSATQSDVRAAFMARYGEGDAASQRACAEGTTPVGSCPGNRRWMQLVFDAWLLMPSGSVSMLDARNAMLAADMLRFGGANQDIMWNAFANRGMGRNATSAGANDTEPVPSFESAYQGNSNLRFTPVDEDGRVIPGAKLYVGEYVARSTPVADTDAGTALGDRFVVSAGTKTYTATAPGFAQTRITFSGNAGQTRDMPVRMVTNLASTQAGGSVSGAGTDVTDMIDGDEGTTARTVAQPTADQKKFTIDLAGGRQVIRKVQVSGLPEPGINRFQNIRQFRISTCDAKGRVLCTEDADFREAFTSAPDALPGAAPRPVAPELKMRTFDIPQTAATHVRFEIVTNQCQGGPEFAGEQDNDPNNATDCATAYAGANTVAVSEVQVLRR
ncbi:peptidase YpeB-like protein [Knoellia remsis]|uniref:Peptidase YpeB-like protein n=1 Tax=Knoellia remsis TaxID=407159 RepID=A0A2T0UE60_9MICO|nr:M36 family metallopeptidase [Knoellia remsis]PRY56107.1 peptidase YpeB-like protein [Knoellia remsis]